MLRRKTPFHVDSMQAYADSFGLFLRKIDLPWEQLPRNCLTVDNHANPHIRLLFYLLFMLTDFELFLN